MCGCVGVCKYVNVSFFMVDVYFSWSALASQAGRSGLKPDKTGLAFLLG